MINPDDIDVEAEIQRVALVWIENHAKYNWNWGDTEEEIQTEFFRRLDDWRKSYIKSIDKVRKILEIGADWTEQYNYRLEEITEENWLSFTHGIPQPISYIEADAEPKLLLGVKEGPIEFHPHCPYDPRLWRAQTGGYACLHPQLHGVLLPLSDKAFRWAVGVSRHWVDSNVYQGSARLDDLNVYRAQLRELDLDCNHSYQNFHEAWYPIDLQHLPKLIQLDNDAQNDIEPTHEAVVNWIEETIAPCPTEKEGLFAGLQNLWWRGNWKLVLVGENCD